MYLCICNSVTDREVRDGATSGATSVKSLCDALGMTFSCGSCATHVKDCLERAREDLHREPAAVAN